MSPQDYQTAVTPPLPVLERVGVQFTETSLSLPSDMSRDDWESFGGTLIQMEKSVQWWIGDWLIYGERKWGETYAQAVLETGRAKGTLANYAYVARRFQPSRRRENIAFTHYQNIAALEPEQQEDMLRRIEGENLTVAESRQLVRTRGASTVGVNLQERVERLESIVRFAAKLHDLPPKLEAQIEAYEVECGWMS